MELNPDQTEAIITLLHDDPRITALYLLGSAVSGTMRADSDIDLAILPAQGCTLGSLERAELTGNLAYAVGREVDLGLVSSRNLVYSREALLTGRLLYTRDRYYTELMAASLMGMYDRFQGERKELMDAYRI
ncbi:MAG: nucleotidyltransferase domain-containing protein [Spirochaetae bacterium HGW-Spirochaetae-7]|jgi:predicted nucleotidyltransferase|nr:MAG: nucleotidyltransferase domain-containing protein [Spirochaetae bacterium HGW-Spirochaetae-7]